MKITNEQLKNELDELTTKFNHLLQTLEDIGLKQKVNFTDLEIVEPYDELDEEEEIKKEDEDLEIPKPSDYEKDDIIVEDDKDDL